MNERIQKAIRARHEFEDKRTELLEANDPNAGQLIDPYVERYMAAVDILTAQEYFEYSTQWKAERERA